MILNSTLIQKINTNLYYAGFLTSGETITVYPWSPREISTEGEISITMISINNLETATIYPRRED